MNKLIIVIVILIIGGAIAFWDIIAPPPTAEPVAVTEQAQETENPAPDFVFTDLNGMEHSLSDFQGRTVLVNVWATWCPPCIFEIPQLVELARRMPDDMVFIGLSVDDKPEPIGKFLNGLPEDVRDNIALDNVFFAHDVDKAISKNILSIAKYPETLIIDRNGGIKTKIEGVEDWLGPEVKGWILDE